MIELMTRTEVTDAVLREALELYANGCFTSLCLANALGGAKTQAWQVIHQFKASEIITEAHRRGIDVRSIKGSVDGGSLLAIGGVEKLIDELDRQKVLT